MARISDERLVLRTKARWRDEKKCWQLNVTIKGQGRISFYSKNTDEEKGRDDVAAQAIFAIKTGERKSTILVKNVYADYVAYLEDNKAKTSVKQPKSFGTNWIIPLVGNKKLSNFIDMDFQKIIDAAANAGLSKKTLSCIKNEFSKFWKWCRKNSLTDYVPQDIDIPLSAPRGTKIILTPKEFEILMTSDTTVIKGEVVPDPLIHLYRYTLLSGMRPGECLGLRNSNFSSDFHVTTVERALNDDNDFTDGKNHNAHRTIVNCELAQKELQLQREEYPVEGDELFFNCTNQQFFRDRLEAYCKANNITRIAPYNFRHTFESYRERPKDESFQKARDQYVGHSKKISSYIHEVEHYPELVAQEINIIFLEILSYAEKLK
ncbi:MAG: hypothetical protein RR058_08180 [Oscillospiraceae bacterium]